MLLPVVNRFLERMRAVDLAYGSQQHQRDFIERYEERQRRHPCAHDHEHVDACYPSGAGDEIARWQLNARKPPPTPHAWRTEALDKPGMMAPSFGEVPWW
jgi:hypothetical protein